MFAKPVQQPIIERAWRWHLQLMAERVFSPFRICATVGSAVWWFVGRHPLDSHNQLEWISLSAAIVFALVCEIVLRFDLPIARMFPLGTVVADWAFIGSSVWASGGRDSPFQSLIMIGLLATSLRVAPKPAVFSTLAYVVLIVSFGRLESMIPDALIFAILGLGVAMWSETMLRQHISAVRDSLTGAYSRDFGMYRLQETVALRCLPFVVGVIDVDGFKAINDMHGHAAGDVVLRQVSHLLASNLRSEDFVCRTGGDEFMTVLRDVDAVTSARLGERLRSGVEGLATSLRPEGGAMYVTISVGLAEASPKMSAAGLLKAADDAMYTAKKNKNRVVTVRCVDDVDSTSTLAVTDLNPVEISPSTSTL